MASTPGSALLLYHPLPPYLHPGWRWGSRSAGALRRRPAASYPAPSAAGHLLAWIGYLQRSKEVGRRAAASSADGGSGGCGGSLMRRHPNPN